MKKLTLTLSFLLLILNIFSQIGPVSTPSPLSSMVQNPTLGITTWRTILPNPIVEVIVAKGTESYTHNSHLFIYPNYALPRADANAERIMFIDSLGNVKVSAKFPFDNRYLKSFTETDPLWSASPSFGITNSHITNWNSAYSWGNHSGLYPLLSGIYSNPSWISTLAYSKITGVPSFLTSEIDPVYIGSSWFSTTNNSANWNTAYGWGNHASAGYLTTSVASTTYQPLIGYTPYNGTTNPNGYLSSVSWSIITGKPTFSTVATSGAYLDLIGLPTLFNGDYNSLINKPTIPTNTNQLTNGAGFLTLEVDGSVTNELQTLSLNSSDTLSISAGNKVKLPYIKTEIDGSITNEIQTLSKVGNQVTLSLSGGNFSVADADSSSSNEIQTIARVGTTVTLSNSGGSFSIDDADNSPTNEIELPSMSGQTGKVLGNNGTTAIWQNASSGTVTSISANAGTGISVTGSPITSSGTLTITNTAPDQTVTITGGQNTKITGSYPNFTVTDSTSTKVYNSSGRINQNLKVWSANVTPSTSNGYSIDISSAGFTTILSANVVAVRNTTSASTSPNVSIKTKSTTSLVVNVVEDNPATITILGINVLSGAPSIFANTTGLSLDVTVIGY